MRGARSGGGCGAILDLKYVETEMTTDNNSTSIIGSESSRVHRAPGLIQLNELHMQLVNSFELKSVFKLEQSRVRVTLVVQSSYPVSLTPLII